jgi:hypothetical protein
MHSQSELRKLMSLTLTLSLLLWVGAGTAPSAYAGHGSVCPAGTMHSQHINTTGVRPISHHCCPQHQSSALSLEESMNSTSPACQQSCCKLHRQPLHDVACLGSDNRQTPHSAVLPVNHVYGAPTTTFEVASSPSPPFHKAVFDLKSDLRI